MTLVALEVVYISKKKFEFILLVLSLNSFWSQLENHQNEFYYFNFLAQKDLYEMNWSWIGRRNDEKRLKTKPW